MNVDPQQTVITFLITTERIHRICKSKATDYQELAILLTGSVRDDLNRITPKSWPRPTLKHFLAIVRDIMVLRWHSKGSWIGTLYTHSKSRNQINECGEDTLTALETAYLQELELGINQLDSVAQSLAHQRTLKKESIIALLDHSPTPAELDYLKVKTKAIIKHELQQEKKLQAAINSGMFDGKPLPPYDPAKVPLPTFGAYNEAARTRIQQQMGVDKLRGCPTFKEIADGHYRKHTAPEHSITARELERWKRICNS